jgi:hypothetical protein
MVVVMVMSIVMVIVMVMVMVRMRMIVTVMVVNDGSRSGQQDMKSIAHGVDNHFRYQSLS